MTTHPDAALIVGYAAGATDLDEATLWSVEVHLETCAECRARVAGGAPADTLALLDRVATSLSVEIESGPSPARRARTWSAARRRWMVWSLLPWLSMTAGLLVTALLLETAMPALPSVVLLIAPVAPLPAVAAAWSRRHDPAWELIAGTPAAGLTMLLRRTLGVLLVAVPLLALAGLGAGAPVALTLVPCLAFTAATIALGAVIGVRRAAAGLAGAWVLAVLTPSLITEDLPVLLRPDSLGVWVLVTVAMAGLALTRADSFRRLSSTN
ncbi:zf-HC2 domain-containing protein [Actinoplanes sp. NBRC 103695]|uniref:zf-HC2 domain-containing protein n=1 Tax=Actinoplanes sp. NBRC 103695 TaxID=3032202 RepID=UPI0024A0A151|nr:zf-HC2 domain-containing protein [Actinoplanes sp. NBRC 103695]GLY99014.1 membrane protein [Actinoplanes sp. NBRC 103695]